MHNVNLDQTALELVLRKHYADMYVTGVVSTYEAFGKVQRNKKAQKKTGVEIQVDFSKIKPHNWDSIKAAEDALKAPVNWDAWKPGNAAASALLKPPGGLEKLLNGIKIVSLDMKNTSYDRLGTQLADGIAVGLSPTKLASSIQDSLSTPERSLTIALTEGSRAANAATMDSYAALGVAQIQWVAADPQDEECDIDGEIVDVDAEFSNGLTGDDLPVHPNCRCSTMPVETDYATFDYGAALDEALNAEG
jgi:SPP1 gp7 family putative phage head morphogenesis protein